MSLGKQGLDDSITICFYLYVSCSTKSEYISWKKNHFRKNLTKSCTQRGNKIQKNLQEKKVWNLSDLPGRLTKWAIGGISDSKDRKSVV